MSATAFCSPGENQTTPDQRGCDSTTDHIEPQLGPSRVLLLQPQDKHGAPRISAFAYQHKAGFFYSLIPSHFLTSILIPQNDNLRVSNITVSRTLRHCYASLCAHNFHGHPKSTDHALTSIAHD